MSSQPALETPPLPIAFRVPGENDWPFIYGYWVNSFIAGRKHQGQLRQSTTARIHALRETQGARFVVAYDPADPGYLYAFGCSEPPLLYYMFVVRAYRRQGIARQMLAHLGLGSAKTIYCTAWTRDAKKVHAAHPKILRRISNG